MVLFRGVIIMNKYKRFYLLCGFVMLASEVWKQLTLTFTIHGGTYNWWYLPFQLCSLPMYLCLALGFCSNSAWTKAAVNFLMDFGLLGGIFAFFDTSGMHYPTLSLTLHSYSWHILLIIIGITAGLSGSGDYSLKGYVKSAALYGTGCIAATLLNFSLHKYGTINMFYISPFYKMNQKVFRLFADAVGNVSAILLYIAATAAGAGIFHLIWSYRNHYFPNASSKSAAFIGRPKK